MIKIVQHMLPIPSAKMAIKIGCIISMKSSINLKHQTKHYAMQIEVF